MYLSHPVRRIRDDPMADEEISLVVDLDDDASVDRLEAVVADLGGRVNEELRFSVLVTVPETAVADLCETDFVERIETADTLGYCIEPTDDETE